MANRIVPDQMPHFFGIQGQIQRSWGFNILGAQLNKSD